MELYWNDIINNLASVGWGLLIFLMSYLSNMSFSIYYNVRILGETFSAEKIKKSLVKIICFGAGTFLLTASITMILPWANANGLIIPEEYSEVITTVATLALCLTGSLKYIVEAVSKMGKILNHSESIENVTKDEEVPEGNAVFPEIVEYSENESVEPVSTNEGDTTSV